MVVFKLTKKKTKTKKSVKKTVSLEQLKRKLAKINRITFKRDRESWLEKHPADRGRASSQPYYNSNYYPPSDSSTRVSYRTQLKLTDIIKDDDFLTRPNMSKKTIKFYGSKLDRDIRNSKDGCDKLGTSRVVESSLMGLAQDFDDNKIEYTYCFLHGGTGGWFSEIGPHTPSLSQQQYEGILTTAPCAGFWFGTPLGYGIVQPTEVLKRIGACCKYRRKNGKYPIFDPQKDWEPELRDGKKETRNMGPYLIKDGCYWPNFDLQSDIGEKAFNTYRETKGGIIEVLEIDNSVDVGAEGRYKWIVATGLKEEAAEYETTTEEIMRIAVNSVREMYGGTRKAVVIFVHCSPVPEDQKMRISTRPITRYLTPDRLYSGIKREIRTDADTHIIESLKRYARLIIKAAITFELFTKHVKNIIKNKSDGEPLGCVMSPGIFGTQQAHKKSAKLFSNIVEACFAEQLCDENGVKTAEGQQVYDRADDYEKSKLNYSIRRFHDLNREQRGILLGPVTPAPESSEQSTEDLLERIRQEEEEENVGIPLEENDPIEEQSQRSEYLDIFDPSNSSNMSDSVSEDLLREMGAKKYKPKKTIQKKKIHKRKNKDKEKDNDKDKKLKRKGKEINIK